jgi:hypothetical protein
LNCNIESIDNPLDGHKLPLRAQGEFGGYTWQFRGDIAGDSAHEWVSVSGTHGGSGGGGSGALPFADLGWKVLGHIGSFGCSSGGWSRKGFMRRAHHPGTVTGVVSAHISKVVVRFKDGEKIEARLLDSGRDGVHFFFVIHKAKAQWVEIVALGDQGQELDRVQPPEISRSR